MTVAFEATNAATNVISGVLLAGWTCGGIPAMRLLKGGGFRRAYLGGGLSGALYSSVEGWWLSRRLKVEVAKSARAGKYFAGGRVCNSSFTNLGNSSSGVAVYSTQ